jgi:hypothetical protein
LHSKRVSNALYDCLGLALDKPRLEAQHQMPRTIEHRITRGIRPRAFHVIRTINLDHEPPSWREEVRGE